MSGRTIFAACARLLVVGMAAACGGTLRAPATPSLPPAQAQLRAGVAEVDITPPLGLGLFGHGPESRIATGVQLRLRCQVFLIEAPSPLNPAGDALALVPCELSAPALLLQREVARLARERGVRVGANRILLMATHTHMAPAHYFPTGSYSGPFSSRLVGYDPRVLHFLAERIAQGLLDAQRDLQPARIAWQQATVDKTVSRNRSLPALLHNRALPAFLRARMAADSQHMAEQAVDPVLSVLRIDQADAFGYAPRGAFAVFGVHPTALFNDTPFYSGDLFGYATRAVARSLHSAHGTRVIVGIANGIEGDSSPARAMAGARESYRLGQLLAGEITQLFDSAGPLLTDAAELSVAYRELDFPSADVSVSDAQGHGLCERPELGTAAGGGVIDQPTVLRFFPQYNQGAHLIEPQPCQGHKLPVQMLDGDTEAGVHFPRFAPITVAELGGHALVTMPAELTTVTGIHVRDAVADALGHARTSDELGRKVVVVGLTNEYLQYVATADEYPLQDYEAASTLYGPQTAGFLADQASCLARSLRPGARLDDCSYGQTSAIDALNTIEFPAPDEYAHMERDGDAVRAAQALSAPFACPTHDGLLALCVRFEGPQPGRVRRRSSLWFAVEKQAADGTFAVIDDDRGTSLSTRFEPYTRQWTVRFTPALAGGVCGRFQLAIGGEQGDGQSMGAPYVLRSQPFTIDCDLDDSSLRVTP